MNEEYQPPLGPDPDLAPVNWWVFGGALLVGAAVIAGGIALYRGRRRLRS